MISILFQIFKLYYDNGFVPMFLGYERDVRAWFCQILVSGKKFPYSFRLYYTEVV